MGALQMAMWAAMVNDSVLAGQLGFTVFDRWPTQSGPGAIPDAYTKHGALKRSIVVLEDDEVPSPARRPGYDRMRVLVVPVIYLFAEAHTNGREAIDAAGRRIVTLFHGREFLLPSGERPLLQATGGRTGARDDESFPGNLRSEVRLQADWGRRLT